MCHVGTAWARVALPRGPKCHVASTWDPREKEKCFANFLIILNILNRKLN